MSEFVNRASSFARVAHYGQMYGNLTYFSGHITLVVNLVKSSGFSSDDILASAYLHDVVEDTDVELSEIGEIFGPTVCNNVRVLTRSKSERYDQYLDRVLRFYEPSVIKACDAMVNFSMTLSEFDRSQKMMDRIQRYSNVVSLVNAKYGFTF